MTNYPNFALGKGGHDATENFEEGRCHVTCDKPSTFKPGMDEKYLDGSYMCKNITGVNCYSRQFIGWMDSVGRSVVGLWVHGSSRHKNFASRSD